MLKLALENWISLDNASAFFLNIPLGLAFGIYTGVIVARYAAFDQLRLQLRRIILKIDFIANGSGVDFLHIKPEEIREIFFIGSDYYYLGHKAVGQIVSQLHAEITDTLNTKPSLGIDKVSKRYTEWQHMIMRLKPNMVTILTPKPRRRKVNA